MKKIFNGDCLDLLERRQAFDCIIADPPDNLGLDYASYKDKLPSVAYYDFIYRRLKLMVECAPIVWLSYYWKHDLEIKYMVRNLLKFEKPTFEAKTFIWRFTFGQHNEFDAGSGFRFILRLRSALRDWSPPSRVQSDRLRTGDPRANPGGKIPDDVWEVPRVTGNSEERRSHHPTQHPVEVYRLMLDGSRSPGLPVKVLDTFGGTGTLFRVPYDCAATLCEIDKGYCEKIAEEHKDAILI